MTIYRKFASKRAIVSGDLKDLNDLLTFHINMVSVKMQTTLFKGEIYDKIHIRFAFYNFNSTEFTSVQISGAIIKHILY